jgi:iodotyrosine deiodinase
MSNDFVYPYIEYKCETFGEKELKEKTELLYLRMAKRRTVREFSDKKIARDIVENLLLSASTAPSGANKQPWTFVAISNPEIKKQIRIEAEQEEYKSYNERMPQEWLDDLKPFGTNWEKPFLEIAPWLIVVFKQNYRLVDGKKLNNYYVTESVGLACGMLLTAIHNAGLVALTHTPSPMNFLSKVLNRPENEKPFLLIPVGYPADKVMVPDISRKSLAEIAVFV